MDSRSSAAPADEADARHQNSSVVVLDSNTTPAVAAHAAAVNHYDAPPKSDMLSQLHHVKQQLQQLKQQLQEQQQLEQKVALELQRSFTMTAQQRKQRLRDKTHVTPTAADVVTTAAAAVGPDTASAVTLQQQQEDADDRDVAAKQQVDTDSAAVAAVAPPAPVAPAAATQAAAAAVEPFPAKQKGPFASAKKSLGRLTPALQHHKQHPASKTPATTTAAAEAEAAGVPNKEVTTAPVQSKQHNANVSARKSLEKIAAGFKLAGHHRDSLRAPTDTAHHIMHEPVVKEQQQMSTVMHTDTAAAGAAAAAAAAPVAGGAGNNLAGATAHKGLGFKGVKKSLRRISSLLAGTRQHSGVGSKEVAVARCDTL